MDSVVGAPEAISPADPKVGAAPRLTGAGAFARTLAHIPVRYRLRDCITKACAGVVLAQGDFLRDALDLVRMPYGEFWIEWDEAPRRAALAEHGVATGGRACVAGLAVRADAGGRRGEIRSFWSDDRAHAEFCPVLIQFDLDAPPHAAPGTIGLDIPSRPALSALLAHARFALEPSWRAYYEARLEPAALRRVMLEAIGPAFGDFPFLLAFSLMLTSGGSAAQPISRARLNAARSKQRAAPLLDHCEISMAVGQARAAQAEEAYSGGRQAPRLHVVRGHLVRRAEKVFWRTSHLRGLIGARPLTKTIHLRLAAA